MRSYRLPSDRAVNANRDRISAYIAYLVSSGNDRHELYGNDSIMSLFCGMPQGMVTHKPILDFNNLTVA